MSLTMNLCVLTNRILRVNKYGDVVLGESVRKVE